MFPCVRFGKADHDEMSILAPVYQCCLFRYSTLEKLLNFHKGPVSLGSAMQQSLYQDAVSPVLLKGHLTALDRRVKIILKTVRECIVAADGRIENVIQDDGF